MHVLMTFCMCFFLVWYVLYEIRKNSMFRPYLHHRGVFLAVTVLISMLCAYTREYLLGFFINAALGYVLYTIAAFLIQKLIPCKKKFHSFGVLNHGLWVLLLTIVITMGSIIRAKEIQITTYEVSFPEKQLKKDQKLLIVSDLHYGTGTDETTLDCIKKTAIEQKTDAILLVGDIFDEYTTTVQMEQTYQMLSGLSKKVPVYFIFGNHEYVHGKIKLMRERFQASGVTVLEDEAVLVNDSFYLIGRMDHYLSVVIKKERVPIQTIFPLAHPVKPVILLDHQPIDLEEARNNHVDLMISGHTHAGQFFPLTILARFFNERFYGMQTKDGLTTIVSSGAGVWGMVMRNQSKSEIVLVTLKHYE